MVEKQDNPAAVTTESEGCELSQQERQRRLDRFWETVERIGERNKDWDPDDVLAEVTAVVEEIRQEQYEREQRAAKERR